MRVSKSTPFTGNKRIHSVLNICHWNQFNFLEIYGMGLVDYYYLESFFIIKRLFHICSVHRKRKRSHSSVLRILLTQKNKIKEDRFHQPCFRFEKVAHTISHDLSKRLTHIDLLVCFYALVPYRSIDRTDRRPYGRFFVYRCVVPIPTSVYTISNISYRPSIVPL